NGNISFDVSDLEASKHRMDTLLGRFDAYYENEQYDASGNRISYALLIRVPNDKFDPLLTSLEKGFGKLTSKSINVDDVSEEYVDISIRLENNLQYLNQYKEILKQAKSIKDIL